MALPADLRAAARQQYVERQLLARRAVIATKHAWSQIDPKGIRGSWHAQVGPVVTHIVTGAQHDSAAMAEPAIRRMLAVQGDQDDPDGAVDPSAFAGTASDGRDLASLLELSNIYSLRRIALGDAPKTALAFGGRWLSKAVATQVVDAGRVAGGVAIASRHHVAGFIRMLDPPSCSRCAILAGAWYRWNAGFERHPGCDCTEIPAAENVAGDYTTDPMAAFRAEKISDLSKADTAAVNEGADLNQVVNAHRGMYSAGGRKFTREGTTLRGSFGREIGRKGATRPAGERYFRVAVPRLTPEQIYREAHGSRDEAIRLLRRFGYLT